MTQNLPSTERKPLTLRERIDNASPEFRKALPGHIPVEKFVRTVQTAVSMSHDIEAACSTPGGVQSLMIACTKAATDGLIIDGREAALVTFNQKVKDRDGERWEKRIQYMPMVAGLMKKARNSGDVIWKVPQVVYSKDAFDYDPVNDAVPRHKPDWFGDRGEPIGVYIVVIVKNGDSDEPIVEIMRREQIMAIAGQSKNPAQYDPKNGKNFEEWWRKTVIRRISKYLPSSSDKDDFMRAVERIDEGFEFEATNGGPTEPAQQPAKKRGAGAAALKDVTPAPKPAEADPQPEQQHDPETGEVYDMQQSQGPSQVIPGDDF